MLIGQVLQRIGSTLDPEDKHGKEEVSEEGETERMNPTPGAAKFGRLHLADAPTLADIEQCATRTNRRRLLGNLVLAKFLLLFAGADTVAETAGEDEGMEETER